MNILDGHVNSNGLVKLLLSLSVAVVLTPVFGAGWLPLGAGCEEQLLCSSRKPLRQATGGPLAVLIGPVFERHQQHLHSFFALAVSQRHQGVPSQRLRTPPVSRRGLKPLLELLFGHLHHLQQARESAGFF